MQKLQKEVFSFLREAVFFNGVSSPVLERLSATIKQKIIDPGSLLIHEGDLGSEAWILVEGELLVFTLSNGEELPLARISDPGTFIGEQALSSERPARNASVRALKKSFLIELNRDSVNTLIDDQAELTLELKGLSRKYSESRLAIESAVIKALAGHGIESLRLKTQEFKDGEAVFQQGDLGENLYVVKSGVAGVWKEDDERRSFLVARLLPGQSFGERALLGGGRRTASVYAEGPLELIVIDRNNAQWLFDNNEDLKSYFRSLERAYSLSSVGLVTRYSGQFLGREAINFLIRREDGAAVIASRLINEPVFSLRNESHDQYNSRAISWVGSDGVSTRKLEISDGRLTSAFVVGDWDEIDTLYELVIDQVSWRERDDRFFQEKGQIPRSLRAGRDFFVCKCMRIKEIELASLISDGANSLALVQNRCGAGTMCGGCVSKIEGLLGAESEFIPVKLSKIIRYSDDVRSFRFASKTKLPLPNAGLGQHIVVRSVMDGVAVERPYTLTSSVKEKGWREITVRQDPRGTFSRHLFNLKEGAGLEISHPRGQLHFTTGGDGALICLVAGVGITPALNICRSLDDLGSKRPVHVLHVIRKRADLVLSEDLKSIGRNKPWLKFDTHITNEEGSISPKTIKNFAEIPDADFLICGPNGFQEMASFALEKARVEHRRIMIETFNKVGSTKQKKYYLPSYLAAGLAIIYFINGMMGPVFDPLAILHKTTPGSLWTGTVLFLFLAMQGYLSVLRWKKQYLKAARNLDFHRWFGFVVVMLLIGHTSELGYGHSFLLSSALLLVIVSAAGLDGGPLSPNSVLLRNVLLVTHICLSVALIGLIATHVAAVFYY